MDEQTFLADRFEANRGHLKAVAYRMLGSAAEADDAVQESWLRLSRSDADSIGNLRGWLTTVVARVCLDMLRARGSRREEAIDAHESASGTLHSDEVSPEGEVLFEESVSQALLIVLNTLAPGERVAFVLHDMFAMRYEEIAPIVGRSLEATRQLASRGRRRLQGGATDTQRDRARQRELVEAFLAAARNADFAALLSVLDPDAVLRADEVAVQTSQARAAAGAPRLAREIRGAAAMADTFLGRAAAAHLALVNGRAGLTWAPGGTPRAVFVFTVDDGKIVAIDLVADPDHMRQLDVEILND